MKMKPLPSLEVLQQAYSYDANSGDFWRGRIRVVQSDSKGYRYLKVQGRHLSAHRVAWKMFYGVDPYGDIDHINGIRSDNRISNLRIATPQQNCANRPAHKNNRLGVKGVRFEGMNYSARIMYKGRAVHIGMFPTPELARRAYESKARELFGEFART